MFNKAKCPSCNRQITNVTIEQHDPSVLSGGSPSYVSVADPCGHAIGAAPASWENSMDTIQRQLNMQQNDIQNISSRLSHIENILSNIASNSR